MIYLDNAATTFPKPPTVSRVVRATMDKLCANPGRSGHDMSIACGELVYRTRAEFAALIGAQNPENCIFTSNCTEALNLAIKGSVRPGMHVVTTLIEHNSVLRVLKTLEKRGFIRLTIVAPREDGIVSPEAIAAAINKRTRLIVMTHASNVLGTIQPVAAIGLLCRRRGITFLVDAAQSAGVVPIDVDGMNIDLLATAGHKGLYGPQGTGFLYIRPTLTLDTLKEGGTGTSSDLLYQPPELPERYESGTLNTPGIAGLFCSLRYVRKNSSVIEAHEKELTSYALDQLSQVKGIQIYATRQISKKVGVVSFNIGQVQSGVIADELNRRGIAVRAGLHCAPGAHQFLGTLDQGAVRVSLGAFNTRADIDALCDALTQIDD